MIKEKQKPIEVFSEIGQLIEVVVHCPGKELENFNIAERGKYLMDGDLD
ncbi:hypothetical protein FACS189459_2930 [Bacilli bacterium]|nr:hypothetical protein FACS189459_2930 [Bacilli bacterium]GHU51712.1 hypothetical protein FACS189496_0500 [Bacilli bacterium]